MVAEPSRRKEGVVGQLAAEWLCTPTSRFVHAAKLNQWYERPTLFHLQSL